MTERSTPSIPELVATIREGLDSRPGPRTIQQQAAGLLALERLAALLTAANAESEL